MKVELEKTYPLPAPAEVAWTLLQDLQSTAGCMPGAKITERIDERNYKGTVAVKFGPASMSFRGEVEVRLVEPATRTLRIVGKGTDAAGGSGASMDLSARIDAVDAANCQLVGRSEVSVSGKAASFGGRMMGSVAEQVLKQFVANFATQAQALQALQTQGAAAVAAEAGADAAPAEPPAAPAAQAQLDGLALVWALIRNWLRSLFGARRR
jgi:uncharacterized protein